MIHKPVLFPRPLLRITSGDFNKFSKLTLKKTEPELRKIAQIEIRLQKIKLEISDQLYKIIPTIPQYEQKVIIIQLRRDIFNERPIAYVKEDHIALLPKNIQALIGTYLTLYTDREETTKHAGEMYTLEREQIKNQFIKLLQEQAFKKGLLLSSTEIIPSFNKYLSHRHKINNNYFKIEKSFVRYLSRMYTKPVPFGAFTQIALAEFKKSNNSNSLSIKNSSKYHVRSYVQLNYYLFGYICGLLFQNKKLRKKFSLRANCTLQKIGDNFVFLTNNNNKESMQSIAITPALEEIYALSQTKSQWKYDKLIVAFLSVLNGSVQKEALEDFIDHLIDLGFFEINFGAEKYEPDWSNKLIHMFSSLEKEFPQLQEVSDLLKNLNSYVNTFKYSPYEKREIIIQKAFQTLEQINNILLSEIGQSSENLTSKKIQKTKEFVHTYDAKFTIKPHNLFREDTTIPETIELSTIFKKNLEHLGEFMNQFYFFDLCIVERYKMTDYFLKKYGENAHIDILRFYEEYSRDVSNSQNDKYKVNNNDAFLTYKNSVEKMLHTFITDLQDQLQQKDAIHIKQTQITHMMQENNIAPSHSSFGSHIQMYYEKKEGKVNPIIVLDSTWPGYGKMYSRFLYPFNNTITASLQEWNKKHSYDTLLSEVADSSYFDVNIHPLLTPFLLKTPGGYNISGDKNTLNLTDVKVSYDAVSKNVQLMHTWIKKRVYITDLGFELKEHRSGLYQFLSYFSLGNHHHISRLIDTISDRIKEQSANKEMVIVPRIIYENSIILLRKRWLISRNILPVKEPGDSDWSYFYKLNLWKNTLEIPDNIYIIHQNKEPEYISFLNPYLVSLFESITRKINDYVIIEEMLPAPEQLSTLENKKHIIECVLQYYA